MKTDYRPSDFGENKTSGGKLWFVAAFFWLIVLCLIPDPKPLGAPDWAVDIVGQMTNLSEPSSRAVATLVLRASGLFLVGLLVSLAMTSQGRFSLAVSSVVLAPVLGLLGQWINYGYFPIEPQIYLAVISTIVGVLAGFGFRKSRVAIVVMILLLAGLFVWGTSTGISDELDAATRMTGHHILDLSRDIPSGDAGFEALVEIAFEYAVDNSHRSDAVFPNRAAILALSVIIGDERVAEVAQRTVGSDRKAEVDKLRNRIKLQGRNDLARHFWVSAGMTVLADSTRSISVGIGKEMMDATPGGSGFSFVDLTADEAGNQFADLATKNNRSAKMIQMLIRKGLQAGDFCPDVLDLPEGLTAEQFQEEFGGLGGKKTMEVVEEIRKRLATCRAFRSIGE